MLSEEADWLYKSLQELVERGEVIFPLGNIGSSDEKQLKTQPWVNDVLMSPLRELGTVYNVDIKQSPDVDFCGDLHDAEFIDKLKQAGLNSILCANILTNIESREKFAKSIMDVIPAKGYVIVSVSNRFPFVADPVDTLFRPNLKELHALFPNTKIVKQELIESISYVDFLLKNKSVLLITLLRLCLPFYKFQHWRNLVQYLPNAFKPFRTSCLVLQKL